MFRCGHRCSGAAIDMIKQERDLGRRVGRTQALEVLQVVAIHCHDMREVQEVVSYDLTCTVVCNVDAVAARNGLGALIGCMTHVPIASASGVYAYLKAKACGLGAKCSLCQW